MKLNNLRVEIGSSISPPAGRYMLLETLNAQLLPHPANHTPVKYPTLVYQFPAHELKQQT